VVKQARAPEGGYVGRSHSLWYCDAQQEGRYGWFETAFMHQPLGRSGARFDIPAPFSGEPGGRPARQALGGGIGTYQVAWPFTLLVDENLDDFVERWATWFAEASTGRLHRPSTMPERNVSGSWRQ
jgi:hypothetical protein